MHIQVSAKQCKVIDKLVVKDGRSRHSDVFMHFDVCVGV